MKRIAVLFLFVALLFVMGCSTLPKPNQLEVPTPIEGSSGEYLSAYQGDGRLTDWAEKGVTVNVLGSAVFGGSPGKKGFLLAG